MTVLFNHTTALPGDANGWGQLLMEHYYEHQQFLTIGLGQTPTQFIPDYAILDWSDEPGVVKLWLEAHQEIHNALRAWTGVNGIDLATVDLTDDSAFLVWLDSHATEHATIRGALGIS